MTVQATAIRRRKQARKDERYIQRRMGEELAEARSRRQARDAVKAAKAGRSFGFRKK